MVGPARADPSQARRVNGVRTALRPGLELRMLISFKMAWSEKKTLCHIRLWSDDGIQAQIEGCKRNREVFDTLAAGMTDEDYVRTGVQWRDK